MNDDCLCDVMGAFGIFFFSIQYLKYFTRLNDSLQHLTIKFKSKYFLFINVKFISFLFLKLVFFFIIQYEHTHTVHFFILFLFFLVRLMARICTFRHKDVKPAPRAFFFLISQ